MANIGTFKRYGDKIDYTATKAIAYHEVVAIGSIVGVAEHSAEVGDKINLDVKGVFAITKKASEAQTAGTKVFLGADGVSATGDTAVGVVWADALADDATVDVAINM